MHRREVFRLHKNQQVVFQGTQPEGAAPTMAGSVGRSGRFFFSILNPIHEERGCFLALSGLGRKVDLDAFLLPGAVHKNIQVQDERQWLPVGIFKCFHRFIF